MSVPENMDGQQIASSNSWGLRRTSDLEVSRRAFSMALFTAYLTYEHSHSELRSESDSSDAGELLFAKEEAERQRLVAAVNAVIDKLYFDRHGQPLTKEEEAERQMIVTAVVTVVKNQGVGKPEESLTKEEEAERLKLVTAVVIVLNNLDPSTVADLVRLYLFGTVTIDSLIAVLEKSINDKNRYSVHEIVFALTGTENKDRLGDIRNILIKILEQKGEPYQILANKVPDKADLLLEIDAMSLRGIVFLMNEKSKGKMSLDMKNRYEKQIQENSAIRAKNPTSDLTSQN